MLNHLSVTIILYIYEYTRIYIKYCIIYTNFTVYTEICVLFVHVLQIYSIQYTRLHFSSFSEVRVRGNTANV